MSRKTRLELPVDEGLKRQIKAAAAKHGSSMSEYCVQAINERLKKEGKTGNSYEVR